jgi:hypothetical protein
MSRKLPKKPKQQLQRKRLRERKKDWSGREDLNLRPPGPELGGTEPILLLFNHLSGASTVSVLLDHASVWMNVNPPVATLARVSPNARRACVPGSGVSFGGSSEKTRLAEGTRKLIVWRLQAL